MKMFEIFKLPKCDMDTLHVCKCYGNMMLIDVYGFHKPSVCKKMQYL